MEPNQLSSNLPVFPLTLVAKIFGHDLLARPIEDPDPIVELQIRLLHGKDPEAYLANIVLLQISKVPDRRPRTVPAHIVAALGAVIEVLISRVPDRSPALVTEGVATAILWGLFCQMLEQVAFEAGLPVLVIITGTLDEFRLKPACPPYFQAYQWLLLFLLDCDGLYLWY